MTSMFNNAIDILAALLSNAQYMNQQTGYTGRRLNETTVTLAGAPTGKVWVRAADAEYPARAVWGSAALPNTKVIIGQDIAGEWRILYAAKSSASGDPYAADASLLPAIDSELNKLTIHPRAFSAGRIRLSQAGGLTVFVESFEYPGGHWAGDNVVLTPPGTAGKKAWCRLALDPRTGTISQVTGPLVDTLIILQDADLPDVPLGYIPLGGVVLANGQTDITGADVFDGRDNGGRLFLGSRQPNCNFASTANPSAGDDVDDGYSVGSLWVNTSARVTYICVDATVGAADWRVASTDGTPLVKLPPTNARNEVQPAADVRALTLRNNASQTTDIFQTQDSSGAVQVAVTAAGGLIVNERGDAAADTRIEGDSAQHLLFVDASADAVGINQNAIASSAVLDIASEAKGVLVPRMNTAQRDAIASPAEGLLIYNIQTDKFEFYNGTIWTMVGGGSGTYYQTLKEAGTPKTQRGALNLIAGSGVTLTIADDAGNDETDVTIAASGGGGSSTGGDLYLFRTFH
jgi:hypothetical protein